MESNVCALKLIDQTLCNIVSNHVRFLWSLSKKYLQKTSKSKTVKGIYEKGYSGSVSNAFEHLCKIEQKENKCFEPQPYVRTMTEQLKYKTGSTGKENDYITREGAYSAPNGKLFLYML